jgi:hypothetical protein
MVDPSYLLVGVVGDGHSCNTPHFFIDAESGQASTRSAAQDFDQRRFLCPPATQTVTGDSENIPQEGR